MCDFADIFCSAIDRLTHLAREAGVAAAEVDIQANRSPATQQCGFKVAVWSQRGYQLIYNQIALRSFDVAVREAELHFLEKINKKREELAELARTLGVDMPMAEAAE
jgi:hypothetical protein